VSFEQKYKDNIRPLMELEKKRQKWGLVLGLAIPLILAGILILLLFLPIR
jgi:hypothetical protein